MLWFTSLIGKSVVWLSRHLGGGHGSALPGLVVEKLSPRFLAKVMSQLPDGVVLVSGTNGKTTTTKIIVDLLRADGYRVFTNTSGSNYIRGVISAALPQMKWGRLKADIAVLELDEAYATCFVDQVKPRYSLLLNVLRDQLDRFGEIDHTAELLQYVAEHTTDAVILNETDPRLARLAHDSHIRARVTWFGHASEASQYYRTDEELHGHQTTSYQHHAGAVLLTKLVDDQATYRLEGADYTTKLRLFGIHNALNCAAALATIRAVEGERFDAVAAIDHLATVRPAYGRGEVITIGDSDIRLILVKNPSGFQLSLDSSPAWPTLIAINDAYADGRDVSWLWDVSFRGSRLRRIGVTGQRAEDMALRLYYDDCPPAWVESDLVAATKRLVSSLNGQSGQIFATYTAMLKIRDQLEQLQSEVNHD